ncbi:ParA family partition ATPase [Pseudomonas lundensis]|jgi:chromosome partitioning protein|uniref:ParA family partition ATPase n=1 Tax=Pseudomonas lundensis TaxID=86185 RepID=UPI00147317B3|nr:ParA family partition ATPase [Pseudomonas lundensis]NNA32874.1 AAA family ATPase [Pseudomonas lundensis]
MACKIVAFLNQKGGSGKTTIATNVAEALSRRGYNVILADTDPQGSARDWKAASESEEGVAVVGFDRAQLISRDLPTVARGADFVIIDGAPQVKDLAASAIKAADLVIIPVQPSPYDIWATADLTDLIKSRQEVADGKPKAGFLISRAIKNTKLSHEITEALEVYGLPILKSGTTQRVIYPAAAAEGKSVLDSADAGALAEVENIASEVLQWLAD